MPLPTTDSEPVASPSPPKSRRSFLVAIFWGLAGAVWAGGVWAVSFGAITAVLKVTASVGQLKSWVLEVTFVMAVVNAGLGLLTGMFIDLLRSRIDHRPVSLVLPLGSAVIGAIIGGLCPPVVVVCEGLLHPLVSSSLVWAFAGFLAGVGGFVLSRWMTQPEELLEEDEEPDRSQRVMWVLRDYPRRLFKFPLSRLLPVLAVSMFSLIGAAILAPSSVSLAFLAIGLLGFAVARVLHNQEKRLRALERRFGIRER